jgi:hypothetical protein
MPPTVDAAGWFNALESIVLLRFFIEPATGEPHIARHNVITAYDSGP